MKTKPPYASSPQAQPSDQVARTSRPVATVTHVFRYPDGSIPPLASALALALLWSQEEPGRVGEILFLPETGGSLFGRNHGADSPSDFMRSIQIRPGHTKPGDGLAAPAVSRRQLEFARVDEASVLVSNVGACPMLVNGSRCSMARLVVGDVLELDSQLLFLVVERSRGLSGWPEGVIPPSHPFGKADPFGIVGESEAIWQLRADCSHFGQRDGAHVLVVGASGSGKELVSKALHVASPRAGGPLISVAINTLSQSLSEWQLFGNTRGAPNRGDPARPGYFGQAEGGTLFMDEIGELGHDLQAKLLRVLESREYTRLGESTPCPTNVRVVMATNRDIAELKHDIPARLTITIVVPGLEARREDIPLVVNELAAKMARADPEIANRYFPLRDIRAYPRVSPRLITKLVQGDLVGQVRGLMAAIELAHQYSRWQGIDYLDLPPSNSPGGVPPGDPEPPINGDPWKRLPPDVRSLLQQHHKYDHDIPKMISSEEVRWSAKGTLIGQRRRFLVAALVATAGDLAEALELLGLEPHQSPRWETVLRLINLKGGVLELMRRAWERVEDGTPPAGTNAHDREAALTLHHILVEGKLRV